MPTLTKRDPNRHLLGEAPVLDAVGGPQRGRERVHCRRQTNSGSLKDNRCKSESIFGDPDSRPGIAGTAYDTAWLASVPDNGDRRSPRFPSSLQWLVNNQMSDGSWGGNIRYEHDRILCTLAALPPLSVFGRRAQDRVRVEAGTRYLWQHGHLLVQEPVELVGFEMVLPTLVERAKRAGIWVPPHLDIYSAQREEKLRLIPSAALYSPRTTIVHSLEFLGDRADLDALQFAQSNNGAIGNSPAATAFFLSLTENSAASQYLMHCLARNGGSTAPVLHPCETFELLWSSYYLHLAGMPAQRLLGPQERLALRDALRSGGVSLSPTFPIPDADDTAVALILLHNLGEEVDPGVLEAFALPDKHFVSFPYERHSSVGVNLHVLHALLRVPGYPGCSQTIDRLLAYLADEQINGLYWVDKWHISPYYATAHAIRIFDELPPEYKVRMKPLIDRSKVWVRQTQNSDGSWGFYGKATAEETAYGILALAASSLGEERDSERCLAGARYIQSISAEGEEAENDVFPPLWIDKCLYTPTLVVKAAIEAARILTSGLIFKEGHQVAPR